MEMEKLFDFLAIIGFLVFLVFIVLGFISLFKKSGKGKKSFGIAAALFVLFIIGAVNSTETDTEKSNTKTDVVEENETKEETEEKKEEVKKEPSTVADVQASVTAGMAKKDFKKAKEKLNVEQPKSIWLETEMLGMFWRQKMD
jgi:amino acid permease